LTRVAVDEPERNPDEREEKRGGNPARYAGEGADIPRHLDRFFIATRRNGARHDAGDDKAVPEFSA
jgi:hypothetical protein